VNSKPLTILLADDDLDDCLFFKETVEEYFPTAQLSILHDGEQLMQYLNDAVKTQNLPAGQAGFTSLPDVLFLDLNMPRKNGFECLSEIKSSHKLKEVPVIIFSTSFEQEVVNLLYKNGAQYFIRKPSAFLQFKSIIHQTINMLIIPQNISQPDRENFVLTVQNRLIV
jgi:CheY-like chemotaxis protein